MAFMPIKAVWALIITLTITGWCCVFTHNIRSWYFSSDLGLIWIFFFFFCFLSVRPRPSPPPLPLPPVGSAPPRCPPLPSLPPPPQQPLRRPPLPPPLLWPLWRRGQRTPHSPSSWETCRASWPPWTCRPAVREVRERAWRTYLQANSKLRTLKLRLDKNLNNHKSVTT